MAFVCRAEVPLFSWTTRERERAVSRAVLFGQAAACLGARRASRRESTAVRVRRLQMTCAPFLCPQASILLPKTILDTAAEALTCALQSTPTFQNSLC